MSSLKQAQNHFAAALKIAEEKNDQMMIELLRGLIRLAKGLRLQA